jgi:Fe-S-cluster containining protein
MSHASNNPCLACNNNQQCCSKLCGLRLSKEEFEKYFQIQADRLSVIEDDKMFIVSAGNDGPCPYWEQAGCKIYYERPIDCRVYPYEIIEIRERKKVIEIIFRDSTDCPQIDHLKMPVEKAEMLMRELGQTTYGYGKPVVIKYDEENEGRSGISRLFVQIIARFSRIFT